jgi:hypothetical protein
MLFKNRSGGDEGDRTPGLGVANAALSRLSYIPVQKISFYTRSEAGASINFLFFSMNSAKALMPF